MTLAYRSGWENQVAQMLESQGIDFEYESIEFEYEVPHVYVPDFILPNGIIIEAKGRFTQYDRRKMLIVIEEYPEYDIRMLFQADKRISKKSRTKYSEWCQRYGIKYAIGEIPREWLN